MSMDWRDQRDKRQEARHDTTRQERDKRRNKELETREQVRDKRTGAIKRQNREEAEVGPMIL